jgi:hypothetical protein
LPQVHNWITFGNTNDWTVPICVALAICLVFPPINNTLRSLAQASGISDNKAPVAPETTVGTLFEWAFPDMDAIPAVGYSVYGFEVTEEYRPPEMLGLRLGISQGFPIKAVAEPGESVTVTCSETPELGTVATMNSPSVGASFVIGNLASCQEGEHSAGKTIGKANQDGGLYWQQMEGGQPTAPRVGYLWWMGLGHEPNFKR